MKKQTLLPEVVIHSFFVHEAEGILTACKIADTIQNVASNIVAGGNEVELTVKDFFQKKLPNKYYVSSGHIIDQNLCVSNQFDIIVADNQKSPILYQTLDETEFLSFESIYLVGEVKKSWYNAKNEDHFTKWKTILRELKTDFHRHKVSPNFIDIGGKGLEIESKTTTNPFKNPLFSFFFMGTSAKLNPSFLQKTFDEADWATLPNVTCILDQGIIVNVQRDKLEKNELKINLYPEFVNRENNEWVLLKFNSSGKTLGSFYFLILEHLNTCVLSQPDMLAYMQKLFSISTDNINFVNQL
jgi:hypothetical protein